MSTKENVKRGAAGMAKATAGRSRTFKDKKKYDRRRDKKVGGE
jgi:hypothetical protein